MSAPLFWPALGGNILVGFTGRKDFMTAIKNFLRKNFKQIVVWSLIVLFLGTLVPSTLFMFSNN
jgi:hypothetical protein